MKKILALILALAMAVSLGACSKRPASTTGNSGDQSSISTPADTQLEESNDEPQTQEPDVTPNATPDETPAQESEQQPEATPEAEPEKEAEETPAQEPEDDGSNANEGKVDSTATVNSTATDLAPGDDSFLALIPELPFENWASTSVDASTIMLEVRVLGSDAQSALLQYIETLRDKDFKVTEYSYGSLYEASKDGVTVTLMLEGGTCTVTIEKA